MQDSTSSLTVTNTENPAPTLEQRVVKIQFHLQTMANSAIIIGQELIECKKEVGHGNWANWLKENFNLSQRVANNFMACAERFGNSPTSANLNQSQMIELLALPEGEEEKFIAEKAAEGNPVENMTVKKLREEVKNYKEKAELFDKEIQRLSTVNQNLRRNLDASTREMLDVEEQNQKLQAENEQLKNQPPQVVETTKTIIPDDYVETKQIAAELQSRVAELQAQGEQAQKTIENLQEQIIDAVSKQADPKIEYVTETSDDFQKLQKELADTQEALIDARKDTRNARDILAAEKYIEQLFQASAALTNSRFYQQALKNFITKHPHTKDKIGALRCICEQLDNAYDLITGKNN